MRFASVMDDAYHNGMNTQYGGVHQRPPFEHSHSFQHQPQHYQDHDGAQTLPPIQSQRPVLQHASHSYDAHYRPTGLQYAPSAGSYQNYYGQTMSQAPYSQGMSQYSTSANFPPPASQPSVNMEYASASAQSGLPVLRPMPSMGLDPNRNAVGGLQDPSAARGNPPRPVVGSQGRRGILPSDEGRPPVAPAEDPASKANFNPAKGPDGKYACPHCPKTYLHAKHLKRHHLRHTGDRPYSCILCGETFSRSDILKRHFQKCSIRRGNPTGATHLSNSQSHLRKQQQQQQQAAKKPDGAPGVGSAFSIVSSSEHAPYGSDSSRNLSTYSSSEQMKRPVDGVRNGLPPTHSPGTSSQSIFSASGQKEPPSLPSSGGSTPVTSKKSGLSSASFTPEIPPQQRLPAFSGGGGDMAVLPPKGAPHMPHLPSTLHGGEFAGWPPYGQMPRDGGGGGGDRMHLIDGEPGARPDAPGLKQEPGQYHPPISGAEDHQSDFMHNFFARGGGNSDGLHG